MASLKDKLKDDCGVSSFSLALSIVTSNPELASKVCDLAEQAADAGLRSDALKEGALQGIEGDVKSLSHDYTLKEQSADMKFKSVVFGGLFDKTAQGDEALRIISDEILNTGGTMSEGIELYNMIDNMDISSISDVARVMTNGDLQAAKGIVDDIHRRLSYYISTNYSVVTTGDPVKLAGVIKKYEKAIKDAQKKIDDALKKTGGKQLRHIDGDLDKVNNLKGTTIEGKKALAKIGKDYGIEDGKRLKERLTKKLTELKKAKDTLESARKEKKALKAAKEYKEALAGDMKIIEDGGNPFNLIEGSDQWKFIKGFNAEPTKRAQQYGQYVLARALLTGGKDLPQEVINVIKSSINGGVVNYLDEHLTEDWILDEDRTLDELLARAYTNTADIANNGQLRNIYRQRILSLASDGEISLKDVDYIESLINTLQFAGSGSGFSDVLKYEYLTRAARNLGIDVPSSRGKDFWNSIINLFKKDQKEFQRSIAGDFVKLGNGIELTNRQLLELVADMLGNININKLIASDTLTDRELLNIAGKYLIGDAVAGGNRLIELFSAAKNAPATDDTRGIILKTITGQNIDKGAKVGFFDFRRGLKADPSVDMRAKFFERLSNANTLELPSGSIEDITNNLERKLSEFKGGYILVNDSQYKMSKRLTDAIDKVNEGLSAEEKVTVIYPTGGLMGTITSDGGRLIYRTSYTNLFNQLVRNISIRMLGQSDVDTRFSKELQEKLLGGDVDALTEYNRLLEEDAQKYFGEMLGIGEEAYKEKLQPMLEQATGISFKNYDAITDKVAFWKKVDENFILTTKVNGNMEQEFITVGDVIKQVDSLTPNQMASDLSNMFGLEVTAKHISDGKKINDEIRDAYLAYKLSETPIELLERKGKLLALLNGGTADNITVNQFKSILQSGDFSSYKELFFHNLELSDEELAKHAKSINDMVFNSLCAEAAMNLVKMGYSLPMVNIRDLVYDFLMDRLNVNGNFARAFLFKNGLPDTLETLRGIVNEIMPKDLRFGYDDGFKYDSTAYNRLGRAVKQGKTLRGTVYTLLDDGTVIEDGERIWGVTADWFNLTDAFLEINTPSVVNGKTVNDLVNTYHIPLFIGEDAWLANFGKRVLGRTNNTRGTINGKKFVQSMINLRKKIPGGTASHELFHAVFGTLAPTETQYFIDTAKKLYKLDDRGANEMLADLFSEYFRTGSFTLPDVGKLQRNASFRAWILQWFQRISDWLLGIDGYEKEVGQLFDDIMNGKLKTTTKKAGYKNIDEWNQINTSRRKTAMAAPLNQARMILTNPGRLDDVINGKITFNELKERLGREFPGLKSEFDLLDESKVDLKNRTYDGLSNNDWRKRYMGHNASSISKITNPVYTDPATGIKYKLTPDDFVNVRGEWRLKTEFVPIEELDKLKEFDRRITPKFSDSNDIIDDLKEKFKKEGIQSPLYIHYSLADGKAYLAEGNHRLAAAKELGMKYLPVWVDVSKKTPSGRGVKVAKPKPFGPGGFYPDSMAPSDIGIKGTISVLNPNTHFMERDDNLLFIEQPTEKEIDNYLSKNNVSDILLGKFGEAKSLDEGLFVTKDGKTISGRYRPEVYPVNKIRADAGYRLNLEHPTAIETAVFNLRKNVGKADTYETASKMLLDRAMEKEGLIRIRPRIASDGNELTITIASKELSPQQKAVISEYISKFKEGFREGTKGQIMVEAQRTDNKGMFPGETINVGLNTSINDIDKVLKEKINSQISERISDEQVFKNRAKQKEDYGEGISLIKLGEPELTNDYIVPYDISIFNREGIDEPSLVPDYRPRLVETKNQFVQDTYSSLIAMAAVKNGERIPSLGNEEQQLERILNDYYNAVAKATENGKTLSFAEAQKLKVKAGYALDMFEQDYVLPRYKNFLTPQERSELMGLKYGLAVGVNSDSLKTIKDYNDSLLNRYRSATQHIISQSDLFISGMGDIDVQKEIEKRQEQLMRQGATLKEVDGQVIVVDTRDELFKELQNIPNNVIGLENLRALGRNGLAQLSNEEAYFLLNLVQLTKNMENKTNLVIQTIYKVSPQLARIDFFNAYRLENNLPRILNNNTLSKSDYISKFNNTTDFDRNVKQSILAKIKEKFARNGKLEYEELGKIIDDSFDENVKLLGNTIKKSELKQVKKEASLLYTKAFQPYTYLKDVPKEVKVSIGNILSEQQKGIRQALSAMGDNNKLVEVMDNISIYGLDGTVKTFREAIDGEPADINKILFNSDNEIIAGADSLAVTPITTDMSNYKKRITEKENAEITKGIENNYEEGLRSYMNDSEMVSQAERDLLNTTLTAARQIAKKYTSTNTIAETDNALASINEEIIRRFKADVLGLTGKFSKGGQRWDIGTRIQDGIMDKWSRVQDRYAQYYSMSDDQLLQIRPNGPIDTMALNMAKYFKEIERRLGSADGLTGITTDAQINRAFGHLGQVVMNVKTINGLYSLMSGIEGNQILKFFRFSNPKQLSYVKRFVIGGEGKETLGGYRTYVDRMDEGLDRDWFNKTFATNFSQSEYRKIVQALTGFTIINKKWKRVENALNFANSSNYLFRTLMSYPGQLITIANQTIAYFLKQKGREDNLGIEDLGTIDEIRKKTGILNGTYNEINWFNGYSPDDVDPSSFYNRYGVPDVEDVYKSKKFYSTDDIETIYAKIDEYNSSKNVLDKVNDWWTKILRNTDAYKDNANNIIDGIFARNFKNIAFVRALQSNSVMRFGTAEQFVKFMASDAPESMKKRLMDALASDSGKHFRNMLGLGFSGLDRAVSGGGILPAWASNIVVGLTQLFNFRGAWGQNIARQTNNFFLTALKMGRAGFSKEGRDAIALFLARQPEFVNFSAQLFNDLRNSRRLVRFQDNGRLPDEDNEYDWMDFIEYAADNMQFASQWWQGIQSYGTTRILTDWGESVLKSNVQPDIYKDTYGVGAFFNSLQKNFGRNWKVPAFAIKAIAQGTTNGTDALWAYLGNERWKLSFGTLRYMMNEDFTSYGYSTETPRRRVGIPFILTGEPDEGDKAFSYDLSNSETWENIANWYDAKSRGDSEAASTYAMNLRDTAFNSSQLLGTVKGVGQIVNGSSLVGSTIKGRMDDMHFYKIVNPFDLGEAGDIIGETEAGAEIMKNGYYIPSNADDVETFIDTIIGQSDFRPGNDGFNKSFFNFDKSGHMKSLDESNEKDAPMEMLLTNMKYLRDDNREFVLDEKGNRITTNYWEKHMNALERNINDEDFLTKSNFNFIYDWVEANNSDPNYMLYKRLIGEGLAGNYLEQKANQYISDFNAINGYKNGTKKMNLTKLKNSNYYDKFIPALSSARINIKGENVPFLEALATLDENALMEADVKIVEKQLARSGNKEAIDKFFSIDKKGNVNLTTKYESFLMEQGRLSRYLRDGDLDSFLAETASITKVFKKDDPYGLMTTTLLGSRVNMINSSDYLSSEQKAKAINVLFKDNSDFIQTHIPEMITEIGDKGLAEAYITQMNDSLYGSSIIADKLITDNEMNNSSSGRSAAKSASDSIKTIMADLAKAAGDSDVVGTKKYNYNFTPAKLNGSALLNIVGGKGYTPTAPTVAIQKYTPHSKFTLKKDVNRLVNGPKTQSVSKKKLLSKLESDTLKAFEAES